MRCLGRFFGCLLILMIVSVAPFSLWLFTIWNVASNADSYTDALDNEAYKELAPLVVPIFAELVNVSTEGDSTGPAASFADVIIALDRDDWENIIQNSIDPLWVRDLINTNLTNLLDYFNYETDELRIQVDLTPLANTIEGSQGDALISDVIDVVRSWDNCTQAETLSMAAFVAGNSDNFPHCNPGEQYLSRLHDQMQTGRAAMVAKLKEYPNYKFDLRQEIAREHRDGDLEAVDADLREVRRGYFFVDNTMAVILLIPLMLFALVIIFAVRSAKEFFFWSGLPLIGTAVFTFLPLLPWAYGLLYGSQNPRAPINSSELELGLRLQRWLFSAFAAPILSLVAIMLVVGFVCLVFAAMMRGPEKRKAQPVYYVVPSGSQPAPVYPADAHIQPGPPTPTPAPIPPQPWSAPPLSSPPPAPGSSSVKVITPKQVKSPFAAPAHPAPLQPPAPVPPPASTPEPPPPAAKPSTAADRFKEMLDKPDVSDDRTFIPPDSHPPESSDETSYQEPYTPKNKLSDD